MAEESGHFEQEAKRHIENNAKRSPVLSEEKISPLQAGIVAVLFIIMFVAAAFVIKSIYFKPSVFRTAAEREISKYKTMIENDPNNSDSHVALAGLYIDNGEPEKAITQLGRALKLDPYSWKADFEMGLAYEALKKYDSAITYYKRASEVNPRNEYPYYQLGRLYHKRGMHKDAIDAYKKALSIDPDLADVHYSLGVCYENTGDKTLAKKEYNEALKYIKDFKEAKEALKRLE
jgi:tetratricopeptide (TPR) repeat protein